MDNSKFVASDDDDQTDRDYELGLVDKLDKLLICTVLDLIAAVLDHASRGELFVAGRLHKRAEETANKIANQEQRLASQELTSAAYNECAHLSQLLAAAPRFSVGVDVAQAAIMRQVLASDTWCEMIGDTKVREMRERLARVARRVECATKA